MPESQIVVFISFQQGIGLDQFIECAQAMEALHNT